MTQWTNIQVISTQWSDAETFEELYFDSDISFDEDIQFDGNDPTSNWTYPSNNTTTWTLVTE